MSITTLLSRPKLEIAQATVHEMWTENFALKNTLALLGERLLESERSQRSLRRSREVADMLREVLRVMNSGRSLHDVLQFILDQAIRLSGVDCGAIFRVNTYTHTMTMEASSGVKAQEKDFAVFVPDALLQRARRYQTLLPDTVANVLIAGILKDEVLREKFAPLTTDLRCGMAAQFKIDGDIYGGIMLCSRKPRLFSREDHEVLEALATQATLAIENAHLRIAATKNAAEEERARLARELHDSVNQAVFGVVLGAQTAQHVAKTAPEKVGESLNYVLEMAQAALTEMRSLIFQLRPDLLEREGLLGVLRAQAEALRVRHRIDVDLDLCDDEPYLSDEAKETAYRIASEAMHNVVKHSRATKMQLHLQVANGVLQMSIRDNGIGFDPNVEAAGCLGLKSMRERVTQVSGKWSIESGLHLGTKVSVAIPI